MFKTNGRQKRPEAREKASNSKKVFICTDSQCGKKKEVRDVEFGEEVLCECGQGMIELNKS